jgi:basic membrane protein A
MRAFAERGYDLIVGVGFAQAPIMDEVARDYPNLKFAIIDGVIDLPNVASLIFKEHEGSFLVGMIAARTSKTGKIGFVGGMDIPLIHKFEAGYRAGVKYVCPDCTVIAQYAGVTPEAFRNPGRGKELALSQYQNGVNVIFHASGSTGLGVFEAARQTGKLAIGVDADQYAEAPGHVLTSMVKGVDAVVFDQIEKARNGTFHGGVQEYGLAENGVGYVYDEHNRALIPDSVHARIEQLRADIIAGRITVPATR